MKEVYLYGLGANLSFAIGSQIFTFYSRQISSSWMNCFKSLVGVTAFGLFITFFGSWHSIGPTFFGLFFLSGFMGLGIGDIFLLKSFSLMGPGRTLMIFGFQPLLIGVLSYILFDQALDPKKFLAIFFCILCLVSFSLESFKKSGTWEFKAIAIAFVGVFLDSVGVIITRYSFDNSPGVTAMEGNFHRCLGAIFAFIILSQWKPFKFFSKWKAQSIKSKSILIFGSLMGTFLSLALYLKAIQTAHLATLSGIAITGTIFSSILECLIEKRWPSRYLLISFGFFLCGMYILSQ